MVKSEPSAQQLNRLIPSCHGRCSEPRPWIVLDILTSRPDIFEQKAQSTGRSPTKKHSDRAEGREGFRPWKPRKATTGRRAAHAVFITSRTCMSWREHRLTVKSALPRLTDTPVWRVVGVVLLAVRSSRDSTSSSLSREREVPLKTVLFFKNKSRLRQLHASRVY